MQNRRTFVRLFFRSELTFRAFSLHPEYMEKASFFKRTLLIIGGWGEIRTHGGVTPTPVFKTGALNHSTTHPYLTTTGGYRLRKTVVCLAYRQTADFVRALLVLLRLTPCDQDTEP